MEEKIIISAKTKNIPIGILIMIFGGIIGKLYWVIGQFLRQLPLGQ